MPAPFPVRRTRMLPWALLACALSIQQAGAQALPPAVVACMDEHDPAQRLACYDREVPRAVAATKRSSAPSSVAGAPAHADTPAASSGSAPTSQAAAAPGASTPSTLSEVDAFGMTSQIQRKENHGTAPPRLDKLAAHITAVSQKPQGEFVVTLDNGQVWEEAEATSHLPLRAGDNITIKRGMLGAFYLSTRQVLGLRVTRVR